MVGSRTSVLFLACICIAGHSQGLGLERRVHPRSQVSGNHPKPIQTHHNQRLDSEAEAAEASVRIKREGFFDLSKFPNMMRGLAHSFGKGISHMMNSAGRMVNQVMHGGGGGGGYRPINNRPQGGYQGPPSHPISSVPSGSGYNPPAVAHPTPIQPSVHSSYHPEPVQPAAGINSYGAPAAGPVQPAYQPGPAQPAFNPGPVKHNQFKPIQPHGPIKPVTIAPRPFTPPITIGSQLKPSGVFQTGSFGPSVSNTYTPSKPSSGFRPPSHGSSVSFGGSSQGGSSSFGGSSQGGSSSFGGSSHGGSSSFGPSSNNGFSSFGPSSSGGSSSFVPSSSSGGSSSHSGSSSFGGSSSHSGSTSFGGGSPNSGSTSFGGGSPNSGSTSFGGSSSHTGSSSLGGSSSHSGSSSSSLGGSSSHPGSSGSSLGGAGSTSSSFSGGGLISATLGNSGNHPPPRNPFFNAQHGHDPELDKPHYDPALSTDFAHVLRVAMRTLFYGDLEKYKTKPPKDDGRPASSVSSSFASFLRF